MGIVQFQTNFQHVRSQFDKLFVAICFTGKVFFPINMFRNVGPRVLQEARGIFHLKLAIYYKQSLCLKCIHFEIKFIILIMHIVPRYVFWRMIMHQQFPCLYTDCYEEKFHAINIFIQTFKLFSIFGRSSN